MPSFCHIQQRLPKQMFNEIIKPIRSCCLVFMKSGDWWHVTAVLARIMRPVALRCFCAFLASHIIARVWNNILASARPRCNVGLSLNHSPIRYKWYHRMYLRFHPAPACFTEQWPVDNDYRVLLIPLSVWTGKLVIYAYRWIAVWRDVVTSIRRICSMQL